MPQEVLGFILVVTILDFTPLPPQIQNVRIRVFTRTEETENLKNSIFIVLL